MSFQSQLKNARLDNGLTQQQVADLLGIDKTTYCGYETGKRQPDVVKLTAIAKALNVSADFLLEVTISSTPPVAQKNKLAPTNEDELDTAILDLILQLGLSEHDVHRLADFAKGIVATRTEPPSAEHLGRK